MPRKEYLSSDERLRFDSPPQLQEVNILIQIPHWAETYLHTLGSASNKVGDRRSVSFYNWAILELPLVFLFHIVSVNWILH